MICCCGDRGKINIKQEFSISTYLNNELENEYNLLLSSSIYIQISYYPSKFWNNYLLSYLDEYNLPRDRIRSMNTDEYLELNLATLPTNREINTLKELENNDSINMITSGNTSGNNEELIIPFSAVGKLYIDSQIDTQNICHPPKIIVVDRIFGKYECSLYLFKEYKTQELIIVPKVDICSTNVKFNYRSLIVKIMRNFDFTNYILINRLPTWKLRVCGHLNTTELAYELTHRLHKMCYTVSIILYEPELDELQNMVSYLLKYKISYLIFTTSSDIANSSYLVRKVVYIPESEMVNYYKYSNPSISSPCDICTGVKKKKNIRSYVHTFFKYIDSNKYLPKIEA